MTRIAHEEKDGKKESVTSKVVGVVYTDIVCYILPGLLFLIGIGFIFNQKKYISEWIGSISATVGVILVFAIPGICYAVGILFALVRMCLDVLFVNNWKRVSLGNLVYGKVSRIILKQVGLPESVRAEARRRIHSDLKKLGWDRGTEESGHSNDNGEQEVDGPPKELVDCFWLLMIGTLRESNSMLFLYYDRWDDIHVARKNLIFTLVLLSFVWFVCIVKRSWGLPTTEWWSIVFPMSVLLILAMFYFLWLPLTRFFDMRWLLLSYLSGRLKVTEEKE